MKGKIKMLVAFLLFSSCLTAQTIIDPFVSSNRVFSAVLGAQNKGFLIITHDQYKRDFYLDFVATSGFNRWTKEIPADQIGYIDSYSDSKELYVFFSPDFIYLFHSRHPSYYGSLNAIRITYEGVISHFEIKTSKNIKFSDFFLKDGKPFTYLSDKSNELKTVNSVALLDFESQSLSNKTSVDLSYGYNEHSPTYIENGRFIYSACDAELKEDGSAVGRIDMCNQAGEWTFHKETEIKAGENFYPVSDHYINYSSSRFSYYSQDAYTHLDINFDREFYFYYGMFSKRKNMTTEEVKDGFYIYKYDFENKPVFENKYLFDDLGSYIPGLKKTLSGDKATAVFVEPVTNSIVYSVEKYFGKNLKSYNFVVDEKGGMNEVYVAESVYDYPKVSLRFSTYGNTDVLPGLTSYYTNAQFKDLTNDQLKKVMEFRSKYAAEKPVVNVLSFGQHVSVLAYLQNQKKFLFQNLN